MTIPENPGQILTTAGKLIEVEDLVGGGGSQPFGPINPEREDAAAYADGAETLHPVVIDLTGTSNLGCLQIICPDDGLWSLRVQDPDGYDYFALGSPGDLNFLRIQPDPQNNSTGFLFQRNGRFYVTDENGDVVANLGGLVNGNFIRGTLTLADLPTVDPNDGGQLWNDNQTLKISAG